MIDIWDCFLYNMTYLISRAYRNPKVNLVVNPTCFIDKIGDCTAIPQYVISDYHSYCHKYEGFQRVTLPTNMNRFGRKQLFIPVYFLEVAWCNIRCGVISNGRKIHKEVSVSQEE
jgi:hypothetical protein